MTTQQTDIEKTLKRILARELAKWPEGAKYIAQGKSGNLYNQESEVVGFIGQVAVNQDFECVTRSQWEAERALLASEQAQPVGDAEEFDQALWDKVAIAAFAIHLPKCYSVKEEISEAQNLAFAYASGDADAFMAERAKRIAARKAGHD